MVLAPLPGPFDATNTKTAIITDPFSIKIRVIERAVTVNDVPLHIMVTGSLDEILELVDEFRGQTLIVLGAVAIMLAVMSTIVARLALRPVAAAAQARSSRCARARRQALTGAYPAELAPLSDEINELLRSNTQIIERARNQVGNLAHGLKTPIAVLRNEAASDKKNPLATVVDFRNRQDEPAGHHLSRPRADRGAVGGGGQESGRDPCDAAADPRDAEAQSQGHHRHGAARCVAALVPRRRGRSRGDGGEPARQCLQVDARPRSA